MEIKVFDIKYKEQIKDLLVELQEYVIEIDKYNLNIISEEYRDKYFDFMLNDCINQQGQIFIAVEDDFVVGFIAGFLQIYEERDKLDYICPKKGVIAELIVSKNCRSNGSGYKLLSAMENYFKSVNCEYIQLDVFAYNDVAKKFYYKNNYEDRMLTLFKKIK